MPGNVIKLSKARKRSTKYAEQLGDLVDHLEDAVVILTEDLVDLAMAGPWATWDSQQPVGTEADISLPALADTRDGNVTRAALMLMDLTRVLREFRKTVPNGPR
jgi:hypothetical protein